jgi:hypothetical protein
MSLKRNTGIATARLPPCAQRILGWVFAAAALCGANLPKQALALGCRFQEGNQNGTPVIELPFGTSSRS